MSVDLQHPIGGLDDNPVPKPGCRTRIENTAAGGCNNGGANGGRNVNPIVELTRTTGPGTPAIGGTDFMMSRNRPRPPARWAMLRTRLGEQVLNHGPQTLHRRSFVTQRSLLGDS